MLRWLNNNILPSQLGNDGANVLFLLKILGLPPQLLPEIIHLIALKDPNSLLNKAIWAAVWYFNLKELCNRLIYETITMNLLRAQLVRELEIFIAKSEKELVRLHRILMGTHNVDIKDELLSKINQQKITIGQLKEKLRMLHELIEKKMNVIQQLQQIEIKFEALAVELSESVIECIDKIYDELDREKIAYINQVRDQEERARLEQELRSQQAERKAAKKRAAMVPDVLRKSGLVVSDSDQVVRMALKEEIYLANRLKASKVKGDEIKQIKNEINETIKPFTEQISAAKLEGDELKKEIGALNEQIEQTVKEVADLEMKLDSSETISLQNIQMDRDTFNIKVQSVLNEIDSFSDNHLEIASSDKVVDLLINTKEEITYLLGNDALPPGQRFSFLSLIIKKLSTLQEAISPELTYLLQELCKTLEEKFHQKHSF